METGKSLEQCLLALVLFISTTNSALSADRPLDPSEQEELCRNFSIGAPAIKTFYSPMFPREYPKHINCFRIITAEYGYFVRVDFRDLFRVEPPSNEGSCDYDYLEIRDGGEGYDTLIGKYCGSDFPPIITSSGRSLWLRFVSDGTIEYKGFKAVYNFIPNPLESLPIIPKCEFEVSGSYNWIGSANISEEQVEFATRYGEPLDCTWIIRTEIGRNISINFHQFKLEHPNDCNYNFIQIFDEKILDEPDSYLRKKYCGVLAESIVSESNTLFIRFFKASKGMPSKFSAHFTVMRKKAHDNEPCKKQEFDCDDTYCIDNNLVCNEIRNCKFGWDEDACGVEGGGIPIDLSKTENVVIIILLFCIMTGMCSGMIYNLIRKLTEDKEDVLASRDKSLASLAASAVSLDRSPVSKHKASRLTLDDEETRNGCYVPPPPEGGYPLNSKL